MTKGQVLDAVSTQVGIDPALRNDLALIFDDRYRELVAYSLWIQRQIDDIGPTVTAQASYTLPENIIDLRALKVDGVTYQRTSQEGMWSLQHGDSYISWGGAYASQRAETGDELIELWPVPSQDGLVIEALVALIPDNLTDSDTPAIPVDYHDCLIDGVAALAVLRFDERPDLAEVYQARWDARRDSLRRRRNTRIGSGPFQVKVVGYQA